MVHVAIGQGEVMVTATVKHVGEQTGAVPAETVGNAKVVLNADYVLNALGTVRTERVQFTLRELTTAVILRPVVNGEETHLIMPMAPRE